MLPPGWVDRVFREFSKNERLVALSGPLVYYDLPWLQSSRRSSSTASATSSISSTILSSRGAACSRGAISSSGRSALDRIGGYDTEIDFYGEDTDIARRMQEAGRIKFTFSLPMYSSGRRMAKEGLLHDRLSIRRQLFLDTAFKRPFHRDVDRRAAGSSLK